MIVENVWRYILSSVVFLSFQVLVSQNTINEEVSKYLIKIEKLVEEEIDNTDTFLVADQLIKRKSSVRGMEEIDLCFKLYANFIYRSTDSAKKYNDEALRLSKEISCKECEYQANCNEAYMMFIEGKFEQSLNLINSIETKVTYTKDSKIYADLQTLKSYIHTERGDYVKALEICLDLLAFGEDYDHHYTLMKSYSAISHIYLRLGEIEKALDYCLKGLNFIIELKKVRNILPKIDEIARMTHLLEGSKKALEIYSFYLRLEKKISDPGAYIQSVVYMNIANIFIEEQKFEKAEDFLSKAVELINDNNYGFRKPRAYLLKAKLYMRTRDTIKAIDSYEKGLGFAEEINAFDVVKDISSSLVDLYVLQGDSLKVSQFSNLYHKVSDSLFTIENNQRIKILEAQRKILEISQQKEILEIRNRFQEDRYRFMLLILILTVIATGIAGYSYIKVKKKNRLLFDRTKELAVEKLNKAKEQNLLKNKKQNNSDRLKLRQRSVDDDTKEIILTRLDKFETEKFYLNSNCNLHQLSEKLQTNQKYLSQVINQEKNSNFNNYLNELRINYLLQKLLEDKDFRNSKLSYIAACSGFNNTNTFNSAFKKRLGILPSYFIQELNEEELKLS